MKPIKIVEFVGMPGSGKTFLANLLYPHLASQGFEGTYLTHGTLTVWSLIRFHLRRLFYIAYLFLSKPTATLQIVWSILQVHPRNPRLLSVSMNMLYKLGFIFYRGKIVVLDEGIIHAVWSVYLFSSDFPKELCNVLLALMDEHIATHNAIEVTSNVSKLGERIARRSVNVAGSHDLAPKGEVNTIALNMAVSKYEEVVNYFEPFFDQVFRLSNTSDASSTLNTIKPQLAALAEFIMEIAQTVYGKQK